MSDGTVEKPAGDASAIFSKVLVVITAVLFVCLALWVGLAVALPEPTNSQTALIEGVSHAFTGCLGALLGLLGGKLA